MIAKLRTHSPAGERQFSHRPASAIRLPFARCDARECVRRPLGAPGPGPRPMAAYSAFATMIRQYALGKAASGALESREDLSAFLVPVQSRGWGTESWAARDKCSTVLTRPSVGYAEFFGS